MRVREQEITLFGADGRPVASQHRNGLWYACPDGPDHEDDLAARLNSLMRQIQQANEDRRQRLAAMRSLYLDVDHDLYADWQYYRDRPCRYPLLQGAVDSTHAQIVVSRPRPKIYTVAADFWMRQRALLRQRWIDGVYHRLNAYERLSEMVSDGLMFGTGVLKVGEEDDQTVIDRVWCGDLWVDPMEERHNRVRTLYQVHSIDRDVLAAMFPKRSEQIAEMSADAPLEDLFPDLEVTGFVSDQLCRVLEAWRLPPSRNKPGRHVIVAGNLVLLDEPWDQPRFPFVFYKWGEYPLRFWGHSMIERGAGMQGDLNELTSIIQDHYEEMVPQMWADKRAQIPTEELDDETGKVNLCNPGPGGIQSAVMVLSPDVAPGLLQREQRLAERFYNVLGVDKLAATAEKPPGLYSAAAIEQYNSSVGGRFLPQGRRLDAASIELAELLFYFADRVAKRGVKQREIVYGRSIGLELLEYDKVKAQDGDVFRIGIKPGSALPRDIAGRIQAVISIRDGAGVPLDPMTIAEMIELPDIDGLEERLFAARENVRRAIAMCAELDEPQPRASTYWDREFALREIGTEINVLEFQGADEQVLRRLRNLHGHVRDLVKREAAEQAANQGAAMPVDQAAAPPMMPNMPAAPGNPMAAE